RALQHPRLGGRVPRPVRGVDEVLERLRKVLVVFEPPVDSPARLTLPAALLALAGRCLAGHGPKGTEQVLLSPNGPWIVRPHLPTYFIHPPGRLGPNSPFSIGICAFLQCRYVAHIVLLRRRRRLLHPNATLGTASSRARRSFFRGSRQLH